MNTKEPKSLPVLLIEDDHDVRRSLRRQLEAEGFEVVGAADGSEGLRLLRDGDFAAVVSDHYMPGMDGVDVLQIARWFKPSAARVLSTGSDELAVVARAVNEADVHGIVPKPWPASGIGELVRSALSRHADARAGKAAAKKAETPSLSPQISIDAAYLAKDELAMIYPETQPPRPPPPAQRPEQASAAVAPKPDAPASVRGLPPAQPCPVILAVDDDARWARCIDRALRGEGYAVHTATSASMALRAMEQGNYAMVLLDVNMPKESGIDLARRVRRGQAGERHRNVPIVFLTSDMTSDSYEGSFEVGALRYVRKSADTNELIGVVQAVMHGG
jgi:CheY-like chemotaxis protein